MKMMGTLLAAMLFAQAAPQTAVGTVQGTIVRVGTAEALAAVQVELIAGVANSPAGARGQFVPAVQPRTATSDNAGNFVIRDVPAGRYTIRILSNGYTGAPTNAPFLTVSGGRTTVADLSAIPGAIIRGRVLDANGQFQSNTNVQAFKIVYQNGLPYLQSAVSKMTDDRGEFRLFGVAPGDYYIGVTPRPPLVNTTPMAGTVRNVQTYFPSATRTTAATRMTIKGGEEISNIDIVMQTALHVRVSGRVISEVGSAPPVTDLPGVFGTIANVQINSATLQLVSRDAAIPEELGARRSAAVLLTASSGEFEIPNVIPGSYDLFASTSGSQGPAYGKVTVTVVDQDAIGLTVVVRRGVEVAGTLTVDGSPASVAPISLQPLDSLLRVGGQFYRRPITADPPGSFSMPGVPEGRFRVVVGGTATYVEDILQNGRSIYDTGFDVGSSSPDPIQVVLKSGVGSVDGLVEDAAGKTVVGATVALVPATRRDNSNLFRNAVTNDVGSFTLQGIAPGEYKLFAWPGLINGAFFDPLYLAKFEEFGRPITVGPSSKTSVKLSIVSAR
jgi:hypothetical protein